jgi:hypothetical protein
MSRDLSFCRRLRGSEKVSCAAPVSKVFCLTATVRKWPESSSPEGADSGTGAYTTTYLSVGFNGFAPLKAYVI